MAPIEMTAEELADALEPLHEESFGWALSCCDYDEPMAEDVLQTAYLRVVSGRARFAGRSAFRTWLFGVIRHVALEMHRRRDARHDRLPDVERLAPRPSRRDDPLESAARSEASRRLVEAMALLPDRQREVLHLVFYEGLTVAEAAEVMGVGVGSARTHYHRAKARMRELLDEETVRD